VHDTAALTGDAFFRCYGDPLVELAKRAFERGEEPSPALRILDVGSFDVNGTLRPYMPAGADYIGVDLVAGRGVDVVLQDPHKLPIRDKQFDLVVSTSCLEHDPAFWLGFAEMARVLAPSGFLYISAPANGPYHGHPGDCWRFYGDAPAALAAWATRCGHTVELVEAFMMLPICDQWIDCVAVFGKPPVPERPRIRDRLLAQLDRPGTKPLTVIK
jgi:SAM-dependent methyltransferase